MTNSWPPKGYSNPKEYMGNKGGVVGIAVIVSLVVGSLAFSAVSNGIREVVAIWAAFSTRVGVTEYPLLDVLGARASVIGFFAGSYFLYRKIVVPLHERIHYDIGDLFDLNPVYREEYVLYFKNPSVVALSKGITVKENYMMLSAPFVVIGIISASVMYIASGVLAGLAAIVLLLNSAASAADLYHVARLSTMEEGTLFANYKDGDRIRTEYVVPGD